MASLRSSSALAVNVVGVWRGADVASLGALVAADLLADRLRFEVTYPTGLRGIRPHLDVVIDRPAGVPVAIESKFIEVYSEARNEFRASYFEKPGLWDGLGDPASWPHAKKRVHIIGSGSVIRHAITRSVQRASGLGVRLWGG